MEDRRPAEVFPPGEFLKEELEARGWTQTDLAEILGRSVRLVNEIIAGKRGITPETAEALGDAFETSAQVWLNLESAYQLWLVRQKDDIGKNADISRRARLFSKAPINDMIRRGWLERSPNVDVLEKRLLDFFGIESLDDPTHFWAVARKSTSYGEITPAQNAWLFRAKQLARTVPAGTFSQAKLVETIERLRMLLFNAEEIRHVPRVLADAGVRFLIIQPLPQTRIDGACFWLDGNSPVIVVSLRFDRVDYFWHTVIHEVGHVKNKDGIDNTTLDTDLNGRDASSNEKPSYEKAADDFAVETLIPQDRLNDFVIRVRPLYSKLRIIAFANLMKVHPGIVAGQLQHRGEISYSSNRDMLTKVRHIITQSALTDGWGYSLPVVS